LVVGCSVFCFVRVCCVLFAGHRLDSRHTRCRWQVQSAAPARLCVLIAALVWRGVVCQCASGPGRQ
jgi:hypothetical protein